MRFEDGFTRHQPPLRAAVRRHDRRGWSLVTIVALAAFGQYQRLWRYVGQRDYEAVLKGVFVATVIVVGGIALLHPVEAATTHTVLVHRPPTPSCSLWPRSPGRRSAVTLPASVITLFFLLTLALLVGARFAVQLFFEGRIRSFRVGKGAGEVLIIGGGDGGRLVVRELMRNPELRLRPVGFLDDDPRKLGIKDEHGLKVLGNTDQRSRTGAR